MLLRNAWVLAAVVVLGCGDDAGTGGGGNGGTPSHGGGGNPSQGGTPNQGGGGSPSLGGGGADNGGAPNGGASQGGLANGGASQGGSANGGASQGGSANGGASQGGGGATQGGGGQGGAGSCTTDCATAHPQGFMHFTALATEACGCANNQPCSSDCQTDPACTDGVPNSGQPGATCAACLETLGTSDSCLVNSALGSGCQNDADCAAFISCVLAC